LLAIFGFLLFSGIFSGGRFFRSRIRNSNHIK
jgi:hypothetical protein